MSKPSAIFVIVWHISPSCKKLLQILPFSIGHSYIRNSGNKYLQFTRYVNLKVDFIQILKLITRKLSWNNVFFTSFLSAVQRKCKPIHSWRCVKSYHIENNLYFTLEFGESSSVYTAVSVMVPLCIIGTSYAKNCVKIILKK